MSKSTISTFELFAMFPDQEAARSYLEGRLWPNGPRCPVCGLGEQRHANGSVLPTNHPRRLTMHNVINYSDKTAADAIEDIREWLGEDRLGASRFEYFNNYLNGKSQDIFEVVCSFLGIHGYPVKAWFESINGSGSWVD